MPLHTLEGPAFQFVKLQAFSESARPVSRPFSLHLEAALRERQREERARHALEDVHQQLARVGVLQAKLRMSLPP